jgi:hypothetical protein
LPNGAQNAKGGPSGSLAPISQEADIARIGGCGGLDLNLHEVNKPYRRALQIWSSGREIRERFRVN